MKEITIENKILGRDYLKIFQKSKDDIVPVKEGDFIEMPIGEFLSYLDSKDSDKKHFESHCGHLKITVLKIKENNVLVVKIENTENSLRTKEKEINVDLFYEHAQFHSPKNT